MMDLKDRLRNFAKREKRNELNFWIGFLLTILSSLFLLSLFLFLPGWILLIASPLILLLLFKTLKPLDLLQVSKRLEKNFSNLKDRLINAFQLSSYSQKKEGYSLELIQAVVSNTEEALAKTPIFNLINKRKPRIMYGLFSIVLGAILLYGFLSPERFSLGLYIAFKPKGLPVEFSITPKNLQIGKDSAITIGVRLSSPYSFPSIYFVKDGKRRKIDLSQNQALLKEKVTKEFSYYFQLFSKKSKVYTIGIRKPLEITQIKFKYIYPSYSRLLPKTTETKELSALLGTRVILNGTASHKIKEGVLLFDDSSHIPLSVDSQKFNGEFIIKRGGEFKVLLKDIFGNRNSPEVFKILPMEDETPIVRIFSPGRDIDLPVSMKVLLGINSMDDYGLKALYLVYNREGTEKRIPLRFYKGEAEDSFYYYWDLTRLGLLPGEEVSYYALVLDNDIYSGPKSSKSETYRVRFPKMEEIYKNVVEKTQEFEGKLHPISKTQKELERDLTRLERDLLEKRKLGFMKKEALNRILARQDTLLKQIKELQQNIRDAINSMQQSMIWDKESLNKLRQIDKLLSEILPEDLQRSINELKKSLGENYPKLKKALGDFKLSQEELRRALDRTLSLLKQLREEERLRSLKETSEELYKTQKDVEKGIGKEPKKKLSELEKDIEKTLSSLKKETKELASEVSDKELAKDLSKLAKEIEEGGLKEEAGKLSLNLSSGELSKSKRRAGKLSSSLKGLKEGYNQAYNKFLAKRQKQIREKLSQAAQDLVSLSKAQEDIERGIREKSPPHSLAKTQEAIKQGTEAVAESLFSLSKRSLTVSPMITNRALSALSKMETTKEELEQGRPSIAQKSSVKAREALDQATAQILRSLNQACSGGTGGSLEDFLEALSKLSLAQMGLNQLTGMVLPIPMPRGGLTPRQLSQLQRILSKQSEIRRELENLASSYSERPGLTSSIEGVDQEMRKIEEDLRKLRISRKILKRQEKVLTRLLDAQRSIREKGFSKKRERIVGKEYPNLPSPSSLPKNLGERKKALRELLLKTLREGYPPEYETLIKAYFNKLMEE